MDWSTKLAAFNDKKIILGLEPTGHYWLCLATWLIGKGISVVQVNPYAVKQIKEVEDNSQLKDEKYSSKAKKDLFDIRQSIIEEYGSEAATKKVLKEQKTARNLVLFPNMGKKY